MMTKWQRLTRIGAAAVLCAGMAVLVSGCLAGEDFENLVPATMREIDRIVQDDSLTLQEKRTALGQLGLDPVIINGIMQGERLANQFGGDLRTAYEKVVGARFTELTPDEIQVYGDEASNVDTADSLNVSLIDKEAQAIVTLFRSQGLNSEDELKAYLDDPASTFPPDIPDGVLQALFVDFDPEKLRLKLP